MPCSSGMAAVRVGSHGPADEAIALGPLAVHLKYRCLEGWIKVAVLCHDLRPSDPTIQLKLDDKHPTRHHKVSVLPSSSGLVRSTISTGHSLLPTEQPPEQAGRVMTKAGTAVMSKEEKRAAKAAKKASKAEHLSAVESTASGSHETVQPQADGNKFEALNGHAPTADKKVRTACCLRCIAGSHVAVQNCFGLHGHGCESNSHHHAQLL